MHMLKASRFSVSVLLLALLFTKISSTAPNQPRGNISSSDHQSFASLRESWRRNLHDKQLDSAMALYADNAIFFVPGAAPANGKAAIRKLFATVMKTFNSDIHLHSSSLEVSGNLAYDSGNYEETLVTTADHKSNQIKGSYLMVLKHEPDGKWRIVQQMWTQDTSNNPVTQKP